VDECLRTLSEIFRLDETRVRDLLIGSWMHNWDQDAFARGAYSYVPARMSAMVQKLATPLAGTLFFAGEATAPEGDQGTVHGAIASGKRAALEVQKSRRRRRTGILPVPTRPALSR
jgi:monoamine oxidase